MAPAFPTTMSPSQIASAPRISYVMAIGLPCGPKIQPRRVSAVPG
jgi:hypothetical protein